MSNADAAPAPVGSTRLRVLQVAPSDRMGGAEKIAVALHRAYRGRGHDAYFAVARKTGDDPSVRLLENDGRRPLATRAFLGLADRLAPVEHVRGVKRIQGLLRNPLAQPRRTLRRSRGHEDFDFPATAGLLDLSPERPEILHLHNLHAPGGYFDLRQLPTLTARVPTVITLHDAWLLAGHCAHSMDCDRWRTGCGQCPDLGIYPAIPRDATAANWRRKREVFSRSRLHVIAPSRWLMDKVGRSMLQSAVVSVRVVPNGVDLDVFRPGDRSEARGELGLPQDARILLFAANGLRSNPFKDYRTFREALSRVAQAWSSPQPLLFLALGESGPDELVGPRATLRHLPFQADELAVARHYRAADLYVHPARADTFPTTVLEALACGRPVVATRVGGIPEQVVEDETGHLTPVGDAAAMAEAIRSLLGDAGRLRAFSAAAEGVARARFDFSSQVDSYLNVYREILGDRRGGIRVVAGAPNPA